MAPRQIFVEGSIDEVDEFCAALCDRLGRRPRARSAVGPKTPADIRDAVEGLRWLEPEYRVWGDFSGSGLVVRSPGADGLPPDQQDRERGAGRAHGRRRPVRHGGDPDRRASTRPTARPRSATSWPAPASSASCASAAPTAAAPGPAGRHVPAAPDGELGGRRRCVSAASSRVPMTTTWGMGRCVSGCWVGRGSG